MKVLGCDPSLTDYGWAVLDMEKPPKDRLIASGRSRTDSDQLFIDRYLSHRQTIQDIHDSYDIDYAGIERPPPQASMSAGLYPVYMYSVEVFYKERTPFCLLMPTTLKMFARETLNEESNAKMAKQDMVEAAKKKIGSYKGRMNHNVADALMEAFYAGRFKMTLDGELSDDDLTEKEHQKFKKTVKTRKTGRIRKEGMVWGEGESHYALDDEKYDEHYETQEDLF